MSSSNWPKLNRSFSAAFQCALFPKRRLYETFWVGCIWRCSFYNDIKQTKVKNVHIKEPETREVCCFASWMTSRSHQLPKHPLTLVTVNSWFPCTDRPECFTLLSSAAHTSVLIYMRFLLLLLGHGCENLLHLVDDVVQLVRVPLCNFLDGVTHRRLDTQAQKCLVGQQQILYTHNHS